MDNIVESQLVKNQRTAEYEEPLTEPCETQSLQGRLRRCLGRRSKGLQEPEEWDFCCKTVSPLLKESPCSPLPFKKIQRALKKLFKENLSQMIKNQGVSITKYVGKVEINRLRF